MVVTGRQLINELQRMPDDMVTFRGGSEGVSRHDLVKLKFQQFMYSSLGFDVSSEIRSSMTPSMLN